MAWVVVTNRDHERAAAYVVKQFGAKLATGGDAPLLSITADRLLQHGETIGGALVIALDGLKTPGEIALYFPDMDRTAIVGDALWGTPAGTLTLMADNKLSDPPRAVLSLRRLLALHPNNLLVGDGAPIFDNAFDVLNACLSGRNDAHVNVINMDQLVFADDPENDPPGYRGTWAEVGFMLGATRLGYAATKLPPGESFCPLHWHTMEEELFIVWDGTPTLRTPRGEVELRSGDIVAFPTNERGAHKLTNKSDAPCTFLMIANDAGDDDVCIYPDSDKVGVPSIRRRLRMTPTLTYYDGEI